MQAERIAASPADHEAGTSAVRPIAHITYQGQIQAPSNQYEASTMPAERTMNRRKSLTRRAATNQAIANPNPPTARIKALAWTACFGGCFSQVIGPETEAGFSPSQSRISLKISS